MNPDKIRELLEAVQSGETTVEDASKRLRLLPFEDIGFAKIDHHRQLRRGFPEVIFGPGKTPPQIRAIASRQIQQGQNVLVTKTTEEAYRAVAELDPAARWMEEARAIVVEVHSLPKIPGLVLVVSAGTSDIPVAEEAALTSELMGSQVERRCRPRGRPGRRRAHQRRLWSKLRGRVGPAGHAKQLFDRCRYRQY
jgi:NCAIR mutase (PurE)-related protein